MISKRPLVVVDTECYIDYWLIMFRHIENGNTVAVELFPGQSLDIERIERVLRNYCIVSFNGRNYDVPMISLALKGATNEQLKRASDTIIQCNMKPWEFEDEFNARPPKYLDHVDLIEVAPGQASLKLYGGRMHSKRLQDLPIEPDASISPEQRKQLVAYCGNDLETTIDLFNTLRDQLELRAQMSDEYEQDLRSKSDAQIAEAVIRSKIQKLTGVKVVKPEYRPSVFNYTPPDFIRFETQEMRAVLHQVKKASFHVENGDVQMPETLDNLKIRIGESIYRMGIGGLHSTEASVAHFSDDEFVLIDRDVTSYYPAIILNQGLYPKHLGENFLKVYSSIVARRLEAKRAGDKVAADSLKITINGSFGKFGSKYSTLFSPDLLIQTTITGQLSLLMLIEALEQNGICAVSANTDGVVIKCSRSSLTLLADIIATWEEQTGFNTEESRYEALYSRDVNNYIAIKTKFNKATGEWLHGTADGVKLKGAYAPPGLSKNPTTPICVEAVIQYLTKRIPIEDTIEWCKDIRKFLVVRRVAGGAVAYRDDVLPKNTTKRAMREVLLDRGWEPDGDRWVFPLGDLDGMTLEDAYEDCRMDSVRAANQYLGKVVRWYYSTRVSAPLRYKTNNNKVAASDNARPMMDLVEGIPEDIDFERYSNMAREILMDIGEVKRPPKEKSAHQIKREFRLAVAAFDEAIAENEL